MFYFILAVGVLSVVLAGIQFYAYFNWYEKRPTQKPAPKQAAVSARLEEGVALDGTL